MAGHVPTQDYRAPTSQRGWLCDQALSRRGREWFAQVLESTLGERSRPSFFSLCPVHGDEAPPLEEGASGTGASWTRPGLSASRPSMRGANFHLPLSCRALVPAAEPCPKQDGSARGYFSWVPWVQPLPGGSCLMFPAPACVGDSRVQLQPTTSPGGSFQTGSWQSGPMTFRLHPEPPGGDVDLNLQPGLSTSSACSLILAAPGSYLPQSSSPGAPAPMYTSAFLFPRAWSRSPEWRAFPTQSRQEPRGQLSLHTWAHRTDCVCALNFQEGQDFGGSGVPPSFYPCLDRKRRAQISLAGARGEGWANSPSAPPWEAMPIQNSALGRPAQAPSALWFVRCRHIPRAAGPLPCGRALKSWARERRGPSLRPASSPRGGCVWGGGGGAHLLLLRGAGLCGSVWTLHAGTRPPNRRSTLLMSSAWLLMFSSPSLSCLLPG